MNYLDPRHVSHLRVHVSDTFNNTRVNTELVANTNTGDQDILEYSITMKLL